jgi:O-antigen/teichoic acid export membrane protein
MDMLGVEVDFSSIIIAIVVGINIQSLSNGVLTSVLKSKKLIYPTIISALSKFPVLFIFISIFDNSEFFIVLSYASSSIVIGLLLGIIVLQTIHQIDGKNVLNIKFNSKLLLKGGISHWIPTMIGTIGTYSGILVIFSTKGAQETGLFYIPFTVYSVLLLVSSAITNISHPVLSGIKTIDEQKGFLKKTLKMNLLLVMPLASIMLFYSQDIFSIFGAEYNFSSEVMNYLIISIPFTVVGYGTYFLFFAKMHYRKILLLGLISNISKVALYFILVPTLGGLGTAIAIMIGELLLVITAIILLEKIQIRLPYKQFLIIIFIPMIIGFIVQLIPIGFIGTIIILPVTFFFYIKFQIMTKEEVCNTSSLILGKEKGTLLANKIEKLFKIK